MSKSPKSHAQLALVQAAGKAGQVTPIKSKPDFYRKAARINDPALLSSITREQAEAEYDATHPEYHEVNFKQAELDEEFDTSKLHRNKALEKLKATPKKIKACAQHSGTEQKDVPFREWSMSNKLSAVMIGFSGLACLIMSAVNVYANLQSSGDAFYVDNKVVCAFIACLAPACSIAIKFLGHLFEDDERSKKRFTHCAFFVSSVSFLIWVLLFSVSYSVSGEVDWSSFDGGGTDLSAHLSFFQLSTEILVGGSLWLALSDIFLIYSPNRKIDNPDYFEALKAFQEQDQKHQQISEERNHNFVRKQILAAERQAYINEKLVDVVDYTSRQQALNDL